jgi:hypothetical protein
MRPSVVAAVDLLLDPADVFGGSAPKAAVVTANPARTIAQCSTFGRDIRRSHPRLR